MTPRATKIVYWVTKRPDLTDEQFVNHWTTVHARLAQDIPGVRAYSINLPSPLQRSSRPIDGYAMLRFDSYADAGAAWATPQGQATAGDGELFMARARHQIVEPRQVFGADPSHHVAGETVKVCYLLDKRANVSADAFADGLIGHGEMLRRLPGVQEYEVNLASAVQRSAPLFDGYAVLVFPGYQDAVQAWQSVQGREAADASRELLSGVRHFIAEERRVVG